MYKQSPLANYLNLSLDDYSHDKEGIFNTWDKAFKTLNFDIYVLSSEDIIQFLLSDGKSIKRPFLIYEGKKVILGLMKLNMLNNLYKV